MDPFLHPTPAGLRPLGQEHLQDAPNKSLTADFLLQSARQCGDGRDTTSQHRIETRMNPTPSRSFSIWCPAGIPRAALIGWLLITTVTCANAATVEFLASPDGRIRIAVQFPKPGSGDRPQWSASFRGQPILSGCGLGLRTSDGEDLLPGAEVTTELRRKVEERVPVPFGKADHADNHFHEIRYALRTARSGRVDVVFRCYDDAIALRYELPESAGSETGVTITEEATSFGLEGDPQAFV